MIMGNCVTITQEEYVYLSEREELYRKLEHSLLWGNYYVYEHISPENKSYIGITRLCPSQRFQNGKGYANQGKMKAALKKYPWEMWSHRLLLADLSENEAKEQELRLILERKTHIVGYNTLASCQNDSAVYEEEKYQRYVADRKERVKMDMFCAYKDYLRVRNPQVDLYYHLELAGVGGKYRKRIREEYYESWFAEMYQEHALEIKRIEEDSAIYWDVYDHILEKERGNLQHQVCGPFTIERKRTIWAQQWYQGVREDEKLCRFVEALFEKVLRQNLFDQPINPEIFGWSYGNCDNLFLADVRDFCFPSLIDKDLMKPPRMYCCYKQIIFGDYDSRNKVFTFLREYAPVMEWVVQMIRREHPRVR